MGTVLERIGMRQQQRRRQSFALIVFLVIMSGLSATDVFASSANLAPFSCCDDGVLITASVGGQPVWQTTPGSIYMYFNVPASFPFTIGRSLYVRVAYYDEGLGDVRLQYDSTTAAYKKSETHASFNPGSSPRRRRARTPGLL